MQCNAENNALEQTSLVRGAELVEKLNGIEKSYEEIVEFRANLLKDAKQKRRNAKGDKEKSETKVAEAEAQYEWKNAELELMKEQGQDKANILEAEVAVAVAKYEWKKVEGNEAEAEILHKTWDNALLKEHQYLKEMIRKAEREKLQPERDTVRNYLDQNKVKKDSVLLELLGEIGTDILDKQLKGVITKYFEDMEIYKRRSLRLALLGVIRKEYLENHDSSILFLPDRFTNAKQTFELMNEHCENMTMLLHGFTNLEEDIISQYNSDHISQMGNPEVYNRQMVWAPLCGMIFRHVARWKGADVILIPKFKAENLPLASAHQLVDIVGVFWAHLDTPFMVECAAARSNNHKDFTKLTELMSFYISKKCSECSPDEVVCVGLLAGGLYADVLLMRATKSTTTDEQGKPLYDIVLHDIDTLDFSYKNTREKSFHKLIHYFSIAVDNVISIHTLPHDKPWCGQRIFAPAHGSHTGGSHQVTPRVMEGYNLEEGEKVYISGGFMGAIEDHMDDLVQDCLRGIGSNFGLLRSAYGNETTRVWFTEWYTHKGDVKIAVVMKMARQYNEVEILQDSTCKNIVKIYGWLETEVEEGWVSVLVLERLTGHFREGSSVSEAFKFALDSLTGLDYLHSKGIVHRDIKPENIGYSEKDECWKIGDFDSAGYLDSNGTAPGGYGTPGFVAPEAGEDGYASPASDLWSLGATIKKKYPGIVKKSMILNNLVTNLQSDTCSERGSAITLLQDR